MGKQLIQIVDEDDNPTITATADEAQAKNLIHRIVIVYVEDENGKILLQKRAATTHLFQGCWDHSAAGHVDAGEDYELAARRELAEELGVKGLSLNEIAYYRSHSEFEGRKLNRFNKVFKVIVTSNYKFKLQESEVSAVEWFTRDQVYDLVKSNHQKVTDGLQQITERNLL